MSQNVPKQYCFLSFIFQGLYLPIYTLATVLPYLSSSTTFIFPSFNKAISYKLEEKIIVSHNMFVKILKINETPYVLQASFKKAVLPLDIGQTPYHMVGLTQARQFQPILSSVHLCSYCQVGMLEYLHHKLWLQHLSAKKIHVRSEFVQF